MRTAYQQWLRAWLDESARYKVVPYSERRKQLLMDLNAVLLGRTR